MKNPNITVISCKNVSLDQDDHTVETRPLVEGHDLIDSPHDWILNGAISGPQRSDGDAMLAANLPAMNRLGVPIESHIAVLLAHKRHLAVAGFGYTPAVNSVTNEVDLGRIQARTTAVLKALAAKNRFPKKETVVTVAHKPGVIVDSQREAVRKAVLELGYTIIDFTGVENERDGDSRFVYLTHEGVVSQEEIAD